MEKSKKCQTKLKRGCWIKSFYVNKIINLPLLNFENCAHGHFCYCLKFWGGPNPRNFHFGLNLRILNLRNSISDSGPNTNVVDPSRQRSKFPSGNRNTYSAPSSFCATYHNVKKFHVGCADTQIPVNYSCTLLKYFSFTFIDICVIFCGYAFASHTFPGTYSVIFFQKVFFI